LAVGLELCVLPRYELLHSIYVGLARIYGAKTVFYRKIAKYMVFYAVHGYGQPYIIAS
jgi:hypothetical protein